MDQPVQQTSTWLGLGRFATTHWSIVWHAKDRDPEHPAALERLCRIYWQPLYAYIRREGYRPEDAQDLTQEFFSRFLEKDWLNHLQDQRGKFRSFLLTLLKHFLSDERAKAGAKKRGGGVGLVSLDQFAAEEQDHLGPVEAVTAEHLYHRRWVQAILEEALERLRLEYVSTGRSRLYQRLSELEPGDRQSPSYAATAAALGMSEPAVKSAVHRLRMRYREILRELVAQTVISPADVDVEIRELMQVL